MRLGGWGRIVWCLLLGGHHSRVPENFGHGTPAPAAVALRADLAPGGNAVLVFVCELVDLMGQFLHCAGPKAAPGASGTLVHALAVAFDSSVDCVLSAVKKGRTLETSSIGVLAPTTWNWSHAEPKRPGTCPLHLSSSLSRDNPPVTSSAGA